MATNTDRVPARRRWLVASLAALLIGSMQGASGAGADSSTIKIAVFDFEFDDFSAGAGIAGDAKADLAQVDKVTAEVRRLLAESGRYVVVEVSGIDDLAVKDRSLRQCNGCEAAIARRLGADQSLLGLVSRISRTEYVERFEIRDAQSGALVLARQSGLRIGADYSWPLGAAALIKNNLLNQP